MCHEFEAKLAHSWPASQWQDVTVVLAVSGGADSVALLRTMHRLKQSGAGKLVVAHFNHGLRRESDLDEAFVLQLCETLRIDCDIERAKVDITTNKAGNGVEATARHLRYEFLKRVAHQRGARYLATAHTANDQAETILHRILRGTGLKGLAGIPRTRALDEGQTLIRPMLQMDRTHVISYLSSLRQEYREDETNLAEHFTRNRIRHSLIPHLESNYNENVIESLLRLGALAGQSQSVIDQLVTQLFDQCVSIQQDGVEIDCRQLASAEPYLVREVLIGVWRKERWPQQDMSYEKWEELMNLVLGDSTQLGNHTVAFPGQIVAKRCQDRVSLK